MLSLPSPVLQQVQPNHRWPAIHLHWRPSTGPPPFAGIEDDSAYLYLVDGGHLALDRLAKTASFCTPQPPSAHELAHPGLAPIGGVFARWLDRSGFHAGAAVIGDGAWAILGRRGMGKSTTLAWLASTGHAVLTDDVLVLEGRTAFAGPRCIDLRPESAARLAGSFALITVRKGHRDRVVLPPVDEEVPFRGWVVLEEAERVEVLPVPPAERLAAIGQHVVIRRAPRNPAALLDLATLPVFRFRRPLRLESLPEAMAHLEATLSG